MTKVTRTFTIDQEVYNRARAMGKDFNMSQEAENGIALALSRLGALEKTPEQIRKEAEQKQRESDIKKVVKIPLRTYLQGGG